jgi:hypothetical protein
MSLNCVGSQILSGLLSKEIVTPGGNRYAIWLLTTQDRFNAFSVIHVSLP